MSTSLSAIGSFVTIYCGIPILVAGEIGGFLNILVFLSLRTFRQSSCALYLIVMQFGNLGQLFFSVVPRIMVAISGSDGTESSLIYCRFRGYFTHVCVGASATCWCLATIDQYFATCSHTRLQQWCNTKLAKRLIFAVIIFWGLHGIPYIVLVNLVKSSTSNVVTCSGTNSIYNQYRFLFIIPVFFGYLPIVIAAIFGSMAFRNVQQMAYRAVPLVRRELEKQLTTMVLVQVIVNIFTLLPYTTINAITTNIGPTVSPNTQANLNFTVTITAIIFYICFASPFYIYMCVSERYRRQFIYVFSTIHPCREERPRMVVNQVMPMS